MVFFFETGGIHFQKTTDAIDFYPESKGNHITMVNIPIHTVYQVDEMIVTKENVLSS